MENSLVEGKNGARWMDRWMVEPLRRIDRGWWLLLAGIVIALGLGPNPESFRVVSEMSYWDFARTTILIAILFGAYVPFLLGLLAVLFGLRFRWWAVLLLVIVVVLVAFFVLFAIFIFSGPGLPIAARLWLAITTAIIGAVFFLVEPKGKQRSGLPLLGSAGLLMAFVVSVWSLVMIFGVTGQAQRIADGRPFCIAHHSEDAPVRSFYELRPTSFFTTRTGYKDTSSWYFHGVLLVEREDGLEFYNWSPRRMRFDKTHGDGWTVGLRDNCEPSDDFLGTLGLFYFGEHRAGR